MAGGAKKGNRQLPDKMDKSKAVHVTHRCCPFIMTSASDSPAIVVSYSARTTFLNVPMLFFCYAKQGRSHKKTKRSKEGAVSTLQG